MVKPALTSVWKLVWAAVNGRCLIRPSAVFNISYSVSLMLSVMNTLVLAGVCQCMQVYICVMCERDSVCVCVCVCVCVYARTRGNVYQHEYANMCLCERDEETMRVGTCVHVYVLVCVCV